MTIEQFTVPARGGLSRRLLSRCLTGSAGRLRRRRLSLACFDVLVTVGVLLRSTTRISGRLWPACFSRSLSRADGVRL